MKYQVVYENIYGNAEILANEIMNILPLESTDLVDLSCQEISDDADVYLIGFEITQDVIPLSIMDVLESLDGKTILCFATCAMMHSESRASIERNLLPFLPDECDYRGFFSCPGQIPVSIAKTVEEALQENPKNERAKTMLGGFQQSLNHPDADDLCELRQFVCESSICI